MGREVENSKIQICKASKSVFHRLVERDAETGPVVTRPGSEPGSRLCSAESPRSQEHAPPRDPHRPAAVTTKGSTPPCTPAGRHAAARVWPSALRGRAGQGGGSPSRAVLRRPHSLLGVWDSVSHRLAPHRLSAAVSNDCIYLVAVEG